MTEQDILERLARAEAETNAAILDAFNAGLQIYVRALPPPFPIPVVGPSAPSIKISVTKDLL